MRVVLSIILGVAFLFVIEPLGHALKVSLRTVQINLYHKQFVPNLISVGHNDDIKICNQDDFRHHPFSLDHYNKFSGVILQPGECYSFRAFNLTQETRRVTVYDEIHSEERLELQVSPGDPGPPPEYSNPPPVQGSSGNSGNGQPIFVSEASYGMNCYNTPGSRVVQGNATLDMRAACDNKTRCEYLIDPRSLGDPAPNCSKEFFASWSCGSIYLSEPRSYRIRAEAANSVLTITCE